MTIIYTYENVEHRFPTQKAFIQFMLEKGLIIKEENTYVKKEFKYLLEYEDKEYKCKTQRQIAKLTGRSEDCINRIVRGINTYKKNDSKDLKEIKITRI